MSDTIIPSPSGWKIPRLRYFIVFALFLAAVLNYIDRSVLGLLAPTIQKDLGISDQQYASVINCFLVGYTIAYLLSGRIVDKLGVRLSMAIFVSWWAISNAMTGLAQSFRSLAATRFSLGLGEAGGFTASPKAVSEWFPPAERGLAVGIYSLGSAVGATIAPILVAVIATQYGWRWVFAMSPILGGIWLAYWLWIYRRPSEHPRITEKERTLLLEANPPAQTEMQTTEAPRSEWSLWKSVLGQPYIWALVLARLLTDPVWYFYQFWMAKYLHAERGLDQGQLSILWIVFLAADLGFLLGGFLSGRLIKRGQSAPASRLWIMLISACLVPLSALVPMVPGVLPVIGLAMIITYAHTSWLVNLTALVVDIVPKTILGTAFGVVAFGSALGGIFMNQLVAALIGQGSYSVCFYIMAFVHPLALLLIWNLRKR